MNRKRAKAIGIGGGATAAAAVALLALPVIASANTVPSIDVSCTSSTYTGNAQLGGSWAGIGGHNVTEAILVDGVAAATDTVNVSQAVPLSLTAPVADAQPHQVIYRLTWDGQKAEATETLTCGTPAPPTPPAPPAPPAPPTPPPTVPPETLASSPVVPPTTPVTPATSLVSAATRTPLKASVCQRPLLDMRLIGPRSLSAGQLVRFTFRVSNSAKNPAPNTILTNQIPSGFSFVSASGASAVRGSSAHERTAGASAISRGAVRLNLGTIPARGSRTVKIVMRVDKTAGGPRVNRARATSGACGATAAAVLPISVKAIGAAVTPAVTG